MISVDDCTQGRSMRPSVTNHLHGMWCEWDWICYRGGAVLFPGWAALFSTVFTGDATSCCLHCPGISATVMFIPSNTILHTFFFHSCWHLFFFKSHLMIFSTGSSILAHPSPFLLHISKTFTIKKMVNGCFQPRMSVRQVMRDYF